LLKSGRHFDDDLIRLALVNARLKKTEVPSYMDPALPNFDIFKKKPAAPSPAAPAPAAPAPPKSSHTEMRNQMLMNSMAKKYESGGGYDKNGARNVVAAVTVDGSGRIVAIDDQCTTMFGWKGQELVGQQLKVLLREGSDNHIASLLQQQRGNESSTQLVSLRVIARRMDGREFPASLTRLTWTPEAPVKTRNTNINLQDCWTAVFRELVPGSESGAPAPVVPVEEVKHTAAPTASRLEDVPQFQGSPAALRSANEELQKKLEAMAVDAWKKGEAVNKAEREREETAKKLEERDNELKQARASLEQELERRKRFEAQLHQVTAGKSAFAGAV
jgi:PAS domain S-box-containing protein